MRESKFLYKNGVAALLKTLQDCMQLYRSRLSVRCSKMRGTTSSGMFSTFIMVVQERKEKRETGPYVFRTES